MRLHQYLVVIIASLLLFTTTSQAGLFNTKADDATMWLTNKTGQEITAVSMRGLTCYPTTPSTDPNVIRAGTRSFKSIVWRKTIPGGQKATFTVFGECWADEVIFWCRGKRVATLRKLFVSNLKTVVITQKGRNVTVTTTMHHKVDPKIDFGQMS